MTSYNIGLSTNDYIQKWKNQLQSLMTSSETWKDLYKQDTERT
jgi:hypothetical protein